MASRFRCDRAGARATAMPAPFRLGLRRPGRKSDFCPIGTLQALRTFARLPPTDQPEGLLGVARVSLRAWRMRGSEKPYQFGHSRTFKIIKWPATWYGAYVLLDTMAVARSSGVAPFLTRQMCTRWPSSLRAWWPTTSRRRHNYPAFDVPRL
jgi:hypothetical protein